MPKMKRIKAKGYKGVYYILGTSPATGKPERIYYIRYRNPSGKLIEEKAGRATVKRTDAEKKGEMTALEASKIRADRMRGRDLPNRGKREAEEAVKAAKAGRWTFNRLWKEYKTGQPGMKRSATDESNFMNYLSLPFGDKEPREVAPLDVDRLRLSLSKKKAPGTVKNVLELLRRLSNFAEKKRLCSPLPFRVSMPRVNNLKTEDLNAEQMARLLAVLRGEHLDDDPQDVDPSVDPDARDVVYMALFTGMRLGEILGLKWDDIDFRRGFITLKETKGGTDTTIPLSDPAREVLKGRIKTESHYVFPGRYGGKRTDIKRPLNKIRNRAKLPKGFRPIHGLRHVFASHLASSGEVDLYTLQRLLTHKSPTMTQRYAHLTDAALKRGANVMSRIVQEAEGKEVTGKER
jgi:integrase